MPLKGVHTLPWENLRPEKHELCLKLQSLQTYLVYEVKCETVIDSKILIMHKCIEL